MKLFILLIFTLASCSQAQSTSRTQVIMGTFCTLTLEDNAHKNMDVGFDFLKELEMILSSYKHEALVYRLNKERSLPKHEILRDILEKSKNYYAKTDGYFDITIGSITKKLYHFGETEQVPSKKDLRVAPLGIDAIILGTDTIGLEDNITIDLGGIGKGYGVDALSAYYMEVGITLAKVALGGDIRCIGSCDIAIQSPFEEAKILTSLRANIKNLSLSTSGTYRRFVKNEKHHHLINPKTKTQGRSFVSVTIVADENNTLCDVMATAIATMPKNVALAFVKAQNIFGYILITPKGEEISGNLEKFVTRH